MVLSGGGARGAYEAGVLAYIFQELPPEIISKGRVSIFCGTSIGAMHACYLTGTAHIHDHDIDRLLNVWRDMRIETMLRLGLLGCSGCCCSGRCCSGRCCSGLLLWVLN